MLRNILGPVFNLYLDQFLTYKICYFFCFFLFFFLAETPIFIVFSAKNAKFKETQKRKKTLFVHTIVLTGLVQVSFFAAFFIFAVFSISVFFEDVFVWFPKIKKYKKTNQAKPKNKNKRKTKDAKQKQMQNNDSKQSKTTSRATKKRT